MKPVCTPARKQIARCALPMVALAFLPVPLTPGTSTPAASALGVSGPAAPTDDLRVLSYELDVDFHPGDGSMTAQALVRFTSPRPGGESPVFFLHNELQVDSVLVDKQPVTFTSDEVDYDFNYSTRAHRIEVALPRGSGTEAMTVFYGGHFRPSDARSPSDYMRIDADGVFLRGYAYSIWFPTFLDSRETSYAVSFPRVTFRTPTEFRTVFVGSMAREYEEDGNRISEWRADDTDLMHVQCTAQRFEVTSIEEIHAYHTPTAVSRAAAAEILSFTDGLIQEFRRAYGPGSPDGQVHLVEMPKYGMIAAGNVSGLPTELWTQFIEQERFQRGLAHELVHQFVFVTVEYADPLWAFAIEGFPSYFHLPSMARLTGEEAYQERLAAVEAAYLQKRETVGTEGSHLPPEVPLLRIPPGEISRYKDQFVLSDRAILFLNFLRTRMGLQEFDAFTQDLFSRDRLDAQTFHGIVEDHLPGSAEAVRIWLETTEYPAELRLEALNGQEEAGR